VLAFLLTFNFNSFLWRARHALRYVLKSGLILPALGKGF